MTKCDFAITEPCDDRIITVGCELGNNSCDNCGTRTAPKSEWDYPGYSNFESGPVCSKCPQCGGLAVDSTLCPDCEGASDSNIPF